MSDHSQTPAGGSHGEPRQRLLAEPLVQQILLSDAVASAGFLILVADEHMRYIAASDSACELLGYAREELLDLTVSDLVVETDAGVLYEGFVASGHQEGRITLRCKDGRGIVAAYRAREARVSGLPGYVSILAPLETDAQPPVVES